MCSKFVTHYERQLRNTTQSIDRKVNKKQKKKKRKKIERQGYDEEKVSQLKRETCCHLLPKNIRKKR